MLGPDWESCAVATLLLDVGLGLLLQSMLSLTFVHTFDTRVSGVVFYNNITTRGKDYSCLSDNLL